MNKVQEHINDGKMWLNSENRWCKKCPSCNSIIIGKDGTVTTKFNVSHSIIKQKTCHSCIKIGKPTWASLNRELMSEKHSGEKHPMYGKHHTDEMKLKQRNRYLGTKKSELTKQKVSQSIKNAWKCPIKRKNMLDRCKWNNTSMDKGQQELIEKWNALGFKFELNHRIVIDNNLFYIDGYDPIHNVVIEYDSKYHSKTNQLKKDSFRQKLIISKLNPKKFWRYNKLNKTFFQYIYI